MNVNYRTIEEKDNFLIAELIRNVFHEFKIAKTGTVYDDPTTDNLYELFETPNSKYWIGEINGEMVGGCGIFPTNGLPVGCGELVKQYLSSNSRGKGIGKELINKSINSAKDLGYKQLYLESFLELENAVGLYIKFGFRYINTPLGKSGHNACTIWMIKDL